MKWGNLKSLPAVWFQIHDILKMGKYEDSNGISSSYVLEGEEDK